MRFENEKEYDNMNQRPLHMSPVNRAGSVSEMSPRHSFLRKNSMCSYEKPGWPGYRDLGFCDRDLRTGMRIFSYEHFTSSDRDETILTK